MRLSHFGAGALAALTSSIANAQFPPKPEGMKVLESRFGDCVQISYKEVSHNPCVPFHPKPHLNGKHAIGILKVDGPCIPTPGNRSAQSLVFDRNGPRTMSGNHTYAESSLERHLRDDGGRSKLHRLHTPTTRYSQRCWRDRPKLPHQYILLVLRVEA